MVIFNSYVKLPEGMFQVLVPSPSTHGHQPPCGPGGWEVVVYAVCSWYPPSPCRVGWGGKGAAYAVWGIDSSWCIQIYK